MVVGCLLLYFFVCLAFELASKIEITVIIRIILEDRFIFTCIGMVCGWVVGRGFEWLCIYFIIIIGRLAIAVEFAVKFDDAVGGWLCCVFTMGFTMVVAGRQSTQEFGINGFGRYGSSGGGNGWAVAAAKNSC